MLKTIVERIICLITTLGLFYSCYNDVYISLPQGENGLSAYEVWVKAVEDGLISWDKERTDINNFFLFLKGEDGKTGEAGKSAYELWVEEVAKGIDDPHNSGQLWSKDKTSLSDFWYFLTGAKGQNGSTPTIGENNNWFIDGVDTGIPAQGQNGQDGQDGQNGQDGSVITIGDNGNWFIDGKDTGITAFGKNGENGNDGDDGKNGQSAYELWVKEVANGIDDPHNPGQQWPKDKTSTADFWEFLRGKDGEDGDSDVIKIVAGVPNVIAQYQVEEYGEYVRWSDGGVSYIVYDDKGEPAPMAKVKGLPGVKNQDTEYEADNNGFFTVPKEDLPDNLPKSDRFGKTSFVTYMHSTLGKTTEESANNTYVPNRIKVRIRISAVPYLSSTNMVVPFIVERMTDSSTEWEPIPSYLGNLEQTITAYVLNDSTDPSSFPSSSSETLANEQKKISSDQSISIARRFKKTDYVKKTFKDTLRWEGVYRHFILKLDSYYGESPSTNAIIKEAPIHLMPPIKNLLYSGFTLNNQKDGGTFDKLSGVFDIANIDTDIIFQKEYVSRNMSGYTLYEPQKYASDELNGLGIWGISVTYKASDGNILSTNYTSLASFNSPQFSLTHAYFRETTTNGVTSYVNLTIGSENPADWIFMPLWSFGRIKKGGTEESPTFVIKATSDYNYTDIAINHEP